MIESLKRLGLTVEHDVAACQITVQGGGGGLPAGAANLWLENSGTSLRFLTAICTLGEGEFRLDGNARMRERPLGDLVAALRQLGAHIGCEFNNDCPPVLVHAAGLPGGIAQVSGNISSQYLSALLMAAPVARHDVTICVAGELVSQPYVEMTLRVMQVFGVQATRTAAGKFLCPRQAYSAADYAIEPDASAASYFFAAAAITGGAVTVLGLSKDSLQGDLGFVEALERMGCAVEYGERSVTVRGGPLRAIDIDMNGISDTAQTLAAIAPFASGKTCIRNVAHIRHKETDRVSALATELRRIGQQVEERPDGLIITPAAIRPATIHTYDDHRMAMSFALVGLKSPGIRIAHPECTAKTYPRFFDDLHDLCADSQGP